VIDLEGGKQPMTGADGKVVLAYNGEIYNFRELRETLKGHGFGFHSSSDTEVLLKGYLHWGISVVERLNGMFAFAVWDHRSGELFLARDRLGKKPLYWALLRTTV
jgi:asparagine synthase (glutamine-hydrolysing)